MQYSLDVQDLHGTREAFICTVQSNVSTDAYTLDACGTAINILITPALINWPFPFCKHLLEERPSTMQIGCFRLYYCADEIGVNITTGYVREFRRRKYKAKYYKNFYGMLRNALNIYTEIKCPRSPKYLVQQN